MKHRIGPGCICSDSKVIFLPAWWLCPLQCQHNVGRRNSLCSVPLHTGDKGDGKCRMLCDESRSHLLEQGGEATIIETAQMWKGWDHRQSFFQQQKLFTPQEAGKEPAEVIKPVIRIKSQLEIQSMCRNDSAGSPSWGWTCGSVTSPNTSSPGICQEPGCNLSVAVMLIVRYPNHSLTHSTTLEGAISMCQTAC